MGASQVSALLYHYVGPVVSDVCRGLTVAPDAFSRQMSTLSALGFETILPTDWVAHVRDGSPLPKRSLLITFDDAYSALIDYAFPVLQKHGFSATVFVPTALAGETIACSPERPGATLPIMPASQIAHWSARGVEFGAHSRTHADLTSLDDDGLDAEMRGSRDDLAEITGKRVTAFAYPFGKAGARELAAAAGLFDAAFTIEEGVIDAATPLSALRRAMVQHNDSIADVCLRARYGSSILARVRTAVASGHREAMESPQS